MPERDRAAVHVHAIPRPAEPVAIGQRLRGERFIGLDQIVVADLGAGLLHEVLHSNDGREEQIPGVAAAGRVAGDAGEDRQAVRLGVRLGRDDERRATVVQAGCVPGRDRVLFRLHVLGRVLREGRLELGEGIERRVLARRFIGVDDRRPLPAGDLHRHDLLLEAPPFDRRDGLLVRAERELVLTLARDPRLLRRVLGVATHVPLVERAPEPVGDQAVEHRLRAELHAHAHPAHIVRRVGHRLLSAGDQQLLVSGADRLCGEHHGLQTGAADLVDRVRRHLAGDARFHRRLTRGSLPHASLQHVAEDHLTHLRDVDLRALHRRTDGDRPELRRGEWGEAPEETADRRAGGGDDDCGVLGHV